MNSVHSPARSALRFLALIWTVVTAVCFSSQTVSGVPLTGGVVDFYHSFGGTLSAVTVDTGSGPMTTGPIAYSLNLADPSAQRFAFDFDTMTASAELDLLVSFPLLTTLGEGPLNIHITESGPIVGGPPNILVGSDQTLSFQALLTGGGLVAPGSIFSGAQFSNINDTVVVKPVNIEAGGTFTQTLDIKGGGSVKIEATITLPDGTKKQTSGTGAFTVASTPVPEWNSSASSLLTIGISIYGLFWVRLLTSKRCATSEKASLSSAP